MAADFLDITITGMDARRSFKRSGNLWNKVFKLSAEVPGDWARLFDEVWEGASYAPKRHARIEEHALVTVCTPKELKGEHMRFLVMAVERTNLAYREFVAGGAQAAPAGGGPKRRRQPRAPARAKKH